MTDTDAPEPDRIPGAPHPRHTLRVTGHAQAEAEFLAAYATGRLHHAWLITGPRGVGKATLAWSIARFLLATPPDSGDSLFGAPPPPSSLQIDPEHPVARRLRALSEPCLFLVRRGGAGQTDSERAKNYADGKFSADIRVPEVRGLGRFVHLSAADGGRRVVIVDAADEMNPQAANALLKMLEEPPARTTLLLISHQPSRLLPTIRSRCRQLRLGTLAPVDMAAALDQAGVAPPEDAGALAELAAGSVGEAVRLITLDGLAIYASLIRLYATLPRLDRAQAVALSNAFGPADTARLDLMFHLNALLLARLARCGALGQPPATEAAPGEAALLARLAPDPAHGRHWANLSQEIGARIAHGRSVNLDPAALVLDTMFRLPQTAA